MLAGQIHIAHRGPVALYYPTVAAAAADGFDPPARDVCAERGEVNRFNGLRGAALELFRSARAGREPRVILHDLGCGAGVDVAGDALFISAVGYAPRALPFVDADGAPIALGGGVEGRAVDRTCRLLTGDGAPLPGAFGLGLGYPRVDASARRRVGVNCFHGGDGADIMRAVLERADVPRGDRPAHRGFVHAPAVVPASVPVSAPSFTPWR